MEGVMPTYVYKCNQCDGIRTVTLYKESEKCCNLKMSITKIYQRNYYNIYNHKSN